MAGNVGFDHVISLHGHLYHQGGNKMTDAIPDENSSHFRLHLRVSVYFRVCVRLCRASVNTEVIQGFCKIRPSFLKLFFVAISHFESNRLN